MSRVTSFSEWLLRQGLIWGSLASLAFYAFIVQGAPDGSFAQQYFAGHTVAYCATVLFFVGAAELLIRWLGLTLQLTSLEGIQLPNAAPGGEEAEEAGGFLASLENISGTLQDSYLVRRLRNALQYVQGKASADTLEPHLRYLEDLDQSRMHQGYALVRIIVSTIPILGFLGTVIGITLAIGKMDLSGSSMDESLPAVVSGLSVAFDTTALALSLSTVLLFIKFGVERVEHRLLSAVDANASRQLIGRFRQYGSENDPHLASVRRISEKLLETVETSVAKQEGSLQRAFAESSQQWSNILASTASTLDEALSSSVIEGLTRHAEALNQGVEHHASKLEGTLIKHAELLNEGLVQHTSALTEAETKLAEENRRHLGDVEAAVGEAMLVASTRQEKLIKQSEDLLKEMQVALIESAGTSVAQQEQLIKQGEVLLKIVEATAHIKQLEDSLNSNLSALAGAHNFQQTAAGLSAAVQLLGAQLGAPLTVGSDIELTQNESKNQAA